MHEPEHREQHDHEPEPADCQPWARPKLKCDGHGRDDEKRNCDSDGRGRPKAGMRIENGEIGRPDELFEVAEDGNEGVGNSRPERQNCRNRTTGPLDEKRD